MRSNRLYLFCVVAALLLILGLFLAQSPAHAHVQVYPHVHPHREAGGVADMLLALLFIYGGAGLWVSVAKWMAGRDARRERK